MLDYNQEVMTLTYVFSGAAPGSFDDMDGTPIMFWWVYAVCVCFCDGFC